MTRILLADDHEVVRRGIRQMLEEAHPDWQVCAEAADGREAVTLTAQLKPDVAVLDLSMPELNGLEAARRIRQTPTRTEVLIFSLHESEELVHSVIQAGARGYVLKSDAARDLVAAVEALAQHRPFFTTRIAVRMVDLVAHSAGTDRPEQASRTHTPLTSREREIVQLLAEGKSNKEVATALRISLKTVQTHRATILRKLGVNSIVALVHYAVRNHLIELA